MAQKLVIVESPAKAKTIKKFLGRGYTVEASMGHVRDLPKSKLGIDIENNFEPKYITIRGKGEIVNKLKKAAKKADKVYLATDPDREGEAISWHLEHILKIDETSNCRIEFNEITEKAVKNAIKNPRPINKDLVDAQQARRALDRIVGYKISPLLWRKVRKGLSAGRVQSVAARIICEREREIEAFESKEYWTLKSLLTQEKEKKNFEASFYGINNKKIELHSRDEVDDILSGLKNSNFIVENVKKGSRKRNAPAPFTTSTLQQEASRKLGFTTKKTMTLAQQLYEGIDIEGEGSIGLITYMRTDSTRISPGAQKATIDLIKAKFGDGYAPQKPNIFKSKKNSQDAHEAIRPTFLKYHPDKIKGSLKRDQLRLYKLIFNRFIASQMTPVIYETLNIQISAGNYNFRASGSKKTFPGYTVVYLEGNDDDSVEEIDSEIPDVKQGDKLKFIEWSPEQHFTQPPPRYTEASLVRTLEDMGIGRPSTYSPTISTILSRGYVEREGRSLRPTELGLIVNNLVVEYFPNIVDYKFTAELENQLDGVEDGGKEWKVVINDFYTPFKKHLDHAEESIEKIEIKDEETDVVCEKCGSNMVIKMGRYGKFLACPNFPDCKNTKTIVEEIDVPCPKCNSKVVVRRSKKGRKFYGCEKYPECDFVSWDLPVKDKCPECGSYMVKKYSKSGDKIVCSNKECGFTKDISEADI